MAGVVLVSQKGGIQRTWRWLRWDQSVLVTKNRLERGLDVIPITLGEGAAASAGREM